ncbi:MAG: type I glyceraldehyde-3-phosphate dehydrogenase [Planktomarina sp.]
MNVFINGFGRIGRAVLRQLVLRAGPNIINVVGINDPMTLQNAAYLFEFDSAFGPFPATVDVDDTHLKVGGQKIEFCHEMDLGKIDLSDVDVVLECTGRATNADFANAGLTAGAKSVLIAGPSQAAQVTVVLGANTSDLGDATLISASSCTTNAIAPLLAAIDLGLGVRSAHATTIHCYTGSQPTIDAPSVQFERGRAAAVSMVPTTTSAAKEIENVLPALSDRISVSSVRVPTHSVSAIDVVVQLDTPLVEPAQEFLREAFEGSPVVSVSDDPCVSVDMRGRPESLILAINETRCVGDDQIRIFGWYDNEWAYAARMIDTAQRMHDRKPFLGE